MNENDDIRNPYSTERARSSWQNGFDGKPRTIMDWVQHHERGRLAGELAAKRRSQKDQILTKQENNNG